MSDLEITALVLSEHEVMRRKFTALEGLDGQALTDAWAELEQILEVHALAEERLFYPLLADGGRAGREDTLTGVEEHNAIRASARAVTADPGSDDWWSQVHDVQEVNAEHMAEEEREFFPTFRDAVDEQRRDELGMQWLAFHDDAPSPDTEAASDPDPVTVAEADVPSAAEELGDAAP